MTEPKIQWSKMSPDRSEQIVLRADTSEEIKTLKQDEIIKGIIFSVENVGKKKVAQEFLPDHPCPKCGGPMKFIEAGVSKRTGQPYKGFYACDSCRPYTR